MAPPKYTRFGGLETRHRSCHIRRAAAATPPALRRLYLKACYVMAAAAYFIGLIERDEKTVVEESNLISKIFGMNTGRYIGWFIGWNIGWNVRGDIGRDIG